MYEYPLAGIAVRDRSERRRPPALKVIRGERETVITVLEPDIRSQVDMATEDSFARVHVGSVAEAMTAVRQYTASAVLLSPSAVRDERLDSITKLVMKNPGLLAIAVVDCSRDPGLLDLGACGVRQLVDVSQPDGWKMIRGLVRDGGGETTNVIMDRVLASLGETTDGARYFFGTLIRVAPRTPTVQMLCSELHAHPSTLGSTFFRAKLPGPKLYLVMARLLYAAAFFEFPQATTVDVAYRLGVSSPQALGRHLRSYIGLTAGEFRREMPLPRALNHFTDRLIVPYRETFRSLDPMERRFGRWR